MNDILFWWISKSNMDNNLSRQWLRRFKSICVRFTIFTHKKINRSHVLVWVIWHQVFVRSDRSGFQVLRLSRRLDCHRFHRGCKVNHSWEKKIRAWGNIRGNTKVTKVIQIGKNTKVRKRRSPKGKRTRWVPIRDHQIKTKGFNWPLSVLSLYKDLQVLQGQAGTVLSTIVTQ